MAEEFLTVTDDAVKQIAFIISGFCNAVIIRSLASGQGVGVIGVESEDQFHLEARSDHLEILLKGEEGLEFAGGAPVISILGTHSPRV